MELITSYMSQSRSYQQHHVIELWNQFKIQGTPEIADFIETICGITRHDFITKFQQAQASDAPDLQAEATLAYIIWCIDQQRFSTIEELLSNH